MIDNLYAKLLKSGRGRKLKPVKGQEPPKGLSLTTVKHVRATLHKALNDATRKRMIPFNPANATEPPE